MGLERIKSRQVLERLRNIFPSWSKVEDRLNLSTSSIKLNDRESIEAELHSADPYNLTTRELIRCHIFRDGKYIAGFSVGEYGLEQIGFGELELSFNGSPGIKIMEGLGIGLGDSLAALHVDVRGEDSKKFQNLAGTVTSWVEDMKFRGEIGDVPLSLTHQIRSS